MATRKYRVAEIIMAKSIRAILDSNHYVILLTIEDAERLGNNWTLFATSG